MIEYKDIMGLTQTITTEEVERVTAEVIDKMTSQVADKIKELNGDKSVSAVFVVGGGGKLPGYTQALAQKLDIQKERVAVRGEEVMQNIEFLEEDARKDSLMVTPIGICLSFYEQSNNFIFVITVNGNEADIYTQVRANDQIKVIESTAGEAAQMEISQLPEFGAKMWVEVNGKKIDLPKFASVNGELQSGYYNIQENDEIEILGYYTVRQIAEFMDVVIDWAMNIYVNNKIADMDTKVYENFAIIWTMEELQLSDRAIYGSGAPDTYASLPEDDGSYVKSEPKKDENPFAAPVQEGDQADETAAGRESVQTGGAAPEQINMRSNETASVQEEVQTGEAAEETGAQTETSDGDSGHGQRSTGPTGRKERIHFRRCIRLHQFRFVGSPGQRHRDGTERKKRTVYGADSKRRCD